TDPHQLVVAAERAVGHIFDEGGPSALVAAGDRLQADDDRYRFDQDCHILDSSGRRGMEREIFCSTSALPGKRPRGGMIVPPQIRTKNALIPSASLWVAFLGRLRRCA